MRWCAGAESPQRACSPRRIATADPAIGQVGLAHAPRGQLDAETAMDAVLEVDKLAGKVDGVSASEGSGVGAEVGAQVGDPASECFGFVDDRAENDLNVDPVQRWGGQTLRVIGDGRQERHLADLHDSDEAYPLAAETTNGIRAGQLPALLTYFRRVILAMPARSDDMLADLRRSIRAGDTDWMGDKTALAAALSTSIRIPPWVWSLGDHPS